jgi:hypothetical protein
MMGFEQAGGVVLYDFWEYAPLGRPHLYPPLLHVIMLGLYKLGLSVINVTRLVSVVTYPAFLLVLWWVIKQLYSERQAFFTLLAATIPYTFLLSSVNAIPATLSLIILMLLFYTVEKKKILAGVLLLGISFYTHGAFAWIIILALFIYGLLNSQVIRPVLIIISGGLVLGLPWLIHLVVHRGYLLIGRSYENRLTEFNILIYICALLGLFKASKEKRRYCFPIALLIAMLPMLIHYRYRFLCGQGLLPFIILAGMGIDGSYQKTEAFLEKRRSRRIYLILLPALFFFLLTFISPVIYQGEGRGFDIRGSSFTNLVPGYRSALRPHELTIYSSRFTEELVDVIKSNTGEDDIIYCNYNYTGGMLSALSGRATSSGMLYESRLSRNFDPLMAASLIVWIKNPQGGPDPALEIVVDKLNFKKLKETDIAYIYKNPLASARRNIIRASVSYRWSFLALFIWAALLLWSFNKRR